MLYKLNVNRVQTHRVVGYYMFCLILIELMFSKEIKPVSVSKETGKSTPRTDHKIINTLNWEFSFRYFLFYLKRARQNLSFKRPFIFKHLFYMFRKFTHKIIIHLIIDTRYFYHFCIVRKSTQFLFIDSIIQCDFVHKLLFRYNFVQ